MSKTVSTSSEHGCNKSVQIVPYTVREMILVASCKIGENRCKSCLLREIVYTRDIRSIMLDYLFIGDVYVFMDEDIARQARAGPVGPNWWPTACNLPPTGLPHPTPAQVCLKTLVTQCTDHLCYVGSAGVMLCLKYKSCWSQRAADASSAWSVRPRYPCIANQGLTRPCPPPHTHSTPLMHTNGSYSSSSSSAAAAAAAGFFLPGPLNVAAFSSGSSPTL